MTALIAPRVISKGCVMILRKFPHCPRQADTGEALRAASLVVKAHTQILRVQRWAILCLDLVSMRAQVLRHDKDYHVSRCSFL